MRKEHGEEIQQWTLLIASDITYYQTEQSHSAFQPLSSREPIHHMGKTLAANVLQQHWDPNHQQISVHLKMNS